MSPVSYVSFMLGLMARPRQDKKKADNNRHISAGINE